MFAKFGDANCGNNFFLKFLNYVQCIMGYGLTSVSVLLRSAILDEILDTSITSVADMFSVTSLAMFSETSTATSFVKFIWKDEIVIMIMEKTCFLIFRRFVSQKVNSEIPLLRN